MKKQVVAIFTEGFADLTEGKTYDVVYESDFYVTIVDDDKDEHTHIQKHYLMKFMILMTYYKNHSIINV